LSPGSDQEPADPHFFEIGDSTKKSILMSSAKARAPLEPNVFDLINCLHARYDTQNNLITKEV